MSNTTETFPPTPLYPAPDGATAASAAEPARATLRCSRAQADLEKELEDVQQQLAEADLRLKTLTGPARFVELDARDVLVEHLQELALQLPSDEPEDPEPDNVVSLFGSQYGDRRSILVTPSVHKMVEEATEAFAEANLPPRIFQRGGRLARFTTDPLSGEPVLTNLGPATFTAELSSMMSFCKRASATDGKPTRVPVVPPTLVVNALGGRPSVVRAGTEAHLAVPVPARGKRLRRPRKGYRAWNASTWPRTSRRQSGFPRAQTELDVAAAHGARLRPAPAPGSPSPTSRG